MMQDMKRGSQCSRLLSEFRRGVWITPAKAYHLCGTMNFHKRRAELARRGFNFEAKEVRVGMDRRTTVKAWRLIDMLQ